jgi:hypothetical protein
MDRSIVLIAGIVLLISQIWLIVLGYKRGGLLWSVLIVFFSLIAGLIFCIKKKAGWLPWALNLVSWAFIIAVYRNWI